MFTVFLITLFFFVRTSKFCLRMAVLDFFSFLRLKCSQFVVSPTEPCNPTKKNARLSTIKTHYFTSFILFLSSSAHRQPLGGVLRKKRFCNFAKINEKIPATEFNFSLELHASSLQLYWSWTPSQVFAIDFEHRCSCILCTLAILKNTYFL